MRKASVAILATVLLAATAWAEEAPVAVVQTPDTSQSVLPRQPGATPSESVHPAAHGDRQASGVGAPAA
jgi:hypothetical protein